MATSSPPLTATIVYGYAWDVNMVSKQTLSYTRTYTNTPGVHNVYDVVANPALQSPSRFETVGIHFTMTPPGGVVTHPHLATVATSRPTRPLTTLPTQAHVAASSGPTAIRGSIPTWVSSGWEAGINSNLASVGFALGLLLSIAFLLISRKAARNRPDRQRESQIDAAKHKLAA